MKLQNKTTKQRITILNIALMIVIIGSMLVYYLLNSEILNSWCIIIFIFSLTLLIYISYLGAPFIKFDSEGETLIIQNEKSVPFSMVREPRTDFPKDKLAKYKIRYRPFYRKELELYIFSKRLNNLSKLVFSISYLDQKQINNLYISLNNIISKNQMETIDIDFPIHQGKFS